MLGMAVAQELPTIHGISHGTGVTCRKCDKEVREFCWLMRVCDMGLTNLGGFSRKEK